MHWLFAVTLVLFATLSACHEEEHLVPKHGIKPKHGLTKPELSSVDAELLLKALMMKLGHSEDSELMHKKIGMDKDPYLYGPDMKDKVHLASMEGSKLRHPMEQKPMVRGYMQEKTIPLEKVDYDVKKGVGITERDIMALLMKMKEISASETLHGKGSYLKYPEEKFITEKVLLSGDPAMLGKSGKPYGEMVQEDKFNDKDVSLAESLYHMKIAGDVETYPAIKLAPLSEMHDKKILDEKLHFEDDHSLHSDESYLKKVDEIGKSFLKEESYPHLKEDDIEGYLKKAVEEDKSLLYEPKMIHPETAFKTTAEEKAVEEWKSGHKDIFTIEGGIFSDEKLKMEGAHHVEEGIALGMNDELLKKLKESLSVDKELKMDGTHHLEGGIAHEISDEMMKKLKESLGLDKEIALEGVLHAEGDIAHDINDELMKKLKASLGLGKEFGIEESLFHADGGISHEINDELLKKLKESVVLDKEFKMDSEHHLEEGMAHEMNDELLKKLKASLGLDKALKIDEEHYLDGGIVHEMSDEELKKLKKSLGSDIAHDELFHLSKELHNEGTAEGSISYEKAKEQIHKDTHISLAEEDLKKYMDEALSFGAKEKVHGTELMFEKGLTAEKAHGIESKVGAGVGDHISVDGVFKDEILKTKEIHAIDKSIGMDKAMFGSKVPLETEVKHTIVHDSSYAAEADKAIKFHEDELLKKEKAYGADSLFHKEGEILKSAEEHHIMKDEDSHILHDSAIEKHHIETGGEKEHKILHSLKAKFFELLRRVLHMRKCHLVTMRPGELLSIVNCVSRSKDPLLCEKFAVCEKKMPIRVFRASQKCQKEKIPGEIKRCTTYAPLYPSTEIPLKIFQCTAISVRELVPQEEKEMIAFEECIKVIKAESCGRFRWFRGPH